MERRAIAVQGVVQGVGFRPFVYGLAARLRPCRASSRIASADVLIEVEGDGGSLDDFLRELAAHPPPLARVEHLAWKPLPCQEGPGVCHPVPAIPTDPARSSSRPTWPPATIVWRSCSIRPIAAIAIRSSIAPIAARG